MSTCHLYKNTNITFRVNGTTIFYGPIKIIYQYYHDRLIELFYNGQWYSAHVVGEANESKIIKVSDTFISDAILKIKTPSGDISLGDIIEDKTIEICYNTIPCEKIESKDPDGHFYLGDTEDLEEKSGWLFGIEFEDSQNKYYTLTNGLIVVAD